MRRAARTDANHSAIVRALERVGCLVADCSRMGHGFPDLLVQRAGRLYLIEVKNPAGRNRVEKAQQDFIALGWSVSVVHSEEEALRAVGLPLPK